MDPDRDRHERVADAKVAWRRELLAARRALTPEALTAARAAVAAHVLADLRPADRVVAAYEPLRTEPGSVELLRALTAAGREVLVPVTLPDRDLSWVRWTPTGPDRRRDRGSDRGSDRGLDLGPDAIGRADVVLVPALAVGRHDGARLGRGGGSYDRALARARGRTLALLHAGELRDEVPSEAHDRPVTAVVTPAGVVTVGRPREAAEAPPRSR